MKDGPSNASFADGPSHISYGESHESELRENFRWRERIAYAKALSEAATVKEELRIIGR